MTRKLHALDFYIGSFINETTSNYLSIAI